MHARGLSKSFGPVTALDAVDLEVGRGEVVALIGENGAGKTTLMNILFGVYQADAGTIAVEGKPVRIQSAADALASGIGMVHQHFHLAPRLTVLENLLVGQAGRGGRLDVTEGRRRLAEIGQRYRLSGCQAAPDALVEIAGRGDHRPAWADDVAGMQDHSRHAAAERVAQEQGLDRRLAQAVLAVRRPGLVLGDRHPGCRPVHPDRSAVQQQRTRRS